MDQWVNRWHPLLYECATKVHQQTEPMTGKFQAGERLRFVNGQQRLDSLEFHNHSLFYDKVRSGIQAEVIVHHGQ